ncbi:MAG: CBS domain-containing protein [Anaerolineae bacterium]
MLVGDIMSRDVFTLAPEASVAEGLHLMNEHGIHRLPVVGPADELLGIVTSTDLRIAEAAGRLTDPVRAVMTKNVATVSEYCPLEDAASIMRQQAIGGMPVLRGDRIVGIVTDSDIFNVFSRLLGVGQPGVRLTLILPNDRDVLPELLQAVTDRGGEIISVGRIKRASGSLMVLKVGRLSEPEVQRIVTVPGVEIADVLTES